jgi:hypothetical protein
MAGSTGVHLVAMAREWALPAVRKQMPTGRFIVHQALAAVDR